MYRIFNKYRILIINALILISLFIAFIAPEGVLKSFFLGLGTGAALVSFGNSFTQLKNKKHNGYVRTSDNE